MIIIITDCSATVGVTTETRCVPSSLRHHLAAAQRHHHAECAK